MDGVFPSVKVGSAEVPKVILGCMPFLGESYQSPEKNRLYAQRFLEPKNVEAIVLKAFFEYGILILGDCSSHIRSPSSLPLKGRRGNRGFLRG